MVLGFILTFVKLLLQHVTFTNKKCSPCLDYYVNISMIASRLWSQNIFVNL